MRYIVIPSLTAGENDRVLVLLIVIYFAIDSVNTKTKTIGKKHLIPASHTLAVVNVS